MDLKEIKAVIDLMTRNGLTEFELEKGDFKIKVKRGPTGEWITSAAPAPAASCASCICCWISISNDRLTDELCVGLASAMLPR